MIAGSRGMSSACSTSNPSSSGIWMSSSTRSGSARPRSVAPRSRRRRPRPRPRCRRDRPAGGAAAPAPAARRRRSPPAASCASPPSAAACHGNVIRTTAPPPDGWRSRARVPRRTSCCKRARQLPRPTPSVTTPARHARPSSRTSITRRSPCALGAISMRPARGAAPMPCLIEFSTSGCSNRLGTSACAHRVAGRDRTSRRSPKRPRWIST